MYILVTASNERLEIEAERIGLQLQLKVFFFSYFVS